MIKGSGLSASFFRKGSDKMTAISYYDSPIGRVLIHAEQDAVCGLWFIGQQHFPDEFVNAELRNEDIEIITRCKAWLDEYFSGGRPEISALKLAPKGSLFRQRVWEILRNIPYGGTTSYGKIARELETRFGTRVSAQAVGGAVGHNPISIIIPCHRVLGADGRLTGYAGGIEKKAFLLRLEADNSAK